MCAPAYQLNRADIIGVGAQSTWGQSIFARKYVRDINKMPESNFTQYLAEKYFPQILGSGGTGTCRPLERAVDDSADYTTLTSGVIRVSCARGQNQRSAPLPQSLDVVKWSQYP